MKTLIITDKPAHYRKDLFNKLTSIYDNKILFYFIGDPKFKQRDEISIFNGELFHEKSKFLGIKENIPGLFKLLLHLLLDKPDLIINSGLSLRFFIIFLYSIICNKKILLWWAGTKQSEKNIPRLKKLFRKRILRCFCGFICYSQSSADYLLSLNNQLQNIYITGNNSFDIKSLNKKITSVKKHQSKKTNKINILCVSYLDKNKNVQCLLNAIKILNNKNIEVTIVGEGSEKQVLKKFCCKNNIESNFTGFVKTDMTYQYYAAADIFVIPSFFDRWPQVYNEAAAARLPIIISKNAGVCNDYIKQNRETVLFDPMDAECLEKLIRKLVSNEKHRKALGANALYDALNNDYKKVISIFTKCIYQSANQIDL